ncbi:MAG: hypothetical protein WCL28_05480 [bacterium]
MRLVLSKAPRRDDPKNERMFLPINVAVCLLASQILAAQPSFADVTVEHTKTTRAGTQKEIRYLTQRKIRIDVIEKDKTTITFIDPVNVSICVRANKPSAKGICDTLLTRDLKAMNSHVFSEKSSIKIVNYKTVPTGKKGIFAGRRCDYFKRSYSMAIGGSSPGSTTETFCADLSLAKDMIGLPEVLMNPWPSLIGDKKLRRQAEISEKKALGLHIFSESWSQLNNTHQAIDFKRDPYLPPDKDAEKQLQELEALYKKTQVASKKPTKFESSVATKVIVGPIHPAVFQTPPPRHEFMKKK